MSLLSFFNILVEPKDLSQKKKSETTVSWTVIFFYYETIIKVVQFMEWMVINCTKHSPLIHLLKFLPTETSDLLSKSFICFRKYQIHFV